MLRARRGRRRQQQRRRPGEQEPRGEEDLALSRLTASDSCSPPSLELPDSSMKVCYTIKPPF
ncbi:Hypothetical predicted protein [Podarcis lilfordi]|uniref:Uncharacterized protein n=1 Tax=Podarcis lilfordi TaxID=74358 RepID=A0AA35L2R6_9SAUR|nr:Hypothetical predicted protein [Podarcis lilfordi]